MPLLPYTKTLGFCQLTTITSAVGLANGNDTVNTVALGNSGGSNYAVGDVVALSGGTGQACYVYVLAISAGGVVTAVGLTYGGANIESGLYLHAATPGTSNVTVVNISALNGAAATGLTVNVTYSVSTIPQQTQRVQLQAVNQAVNWRDDGVSPTAATTGVGMQLVAGLAPWLYEGNAANVSVIQVTTGAILNVWFQQFVGSVAQGR